MARRLKDQKRSEYDCTAKRCPKPADFARFPELMNDVRNEWQQRLIFQRSGDYKRRRAVAKSQWKGRQSKEKRK